VLWRTYIFTCNFDIGREVREMKTKTVIALPLFLMLMLIFVAVGHPVPAEEVKVGIELTPQELLKKITAAYEGVDTMHVDVETTSDMTKVMLGEGIEMRIRTSSSMRSEMKVDVINQRMMSTGLMETTTPQLPGIPKGSVMKMAMEMYWLDGAVYMKMDMETPEALCMPGMLCMPSPGWTKVEVPWVSPLEQIVALLKASEINILQVEEVNGVESYLIKISPDFGKLWDVMMMTAPPGMRMDLQAMGMDLEEIVRESSIKQWICRDTFLPVKDQTQMTMVFEMGTEGMKMEMEMEMKMDITSRNYRFNDPVTIELPVEAKEAVKMPLP
jgi:hypothetical protein